jgi:hypothetical protein
MHFMWRATAAFLGAMRAKVSQQCFVSCKPSALCVIIPQPCDGKAPISDAPRHVTTGLHQVVSQDFDAQYKRHELGEVLAMHRPNKSNG